MSNDKTFKPEKSWNIVYLLMSPTKWRSIDDMTEIARRNKLWIARSKEWLEQSRDLYPDKRFMTKSMWWWKIACFLSVLETQYGKRTFIKRPGKDGFYSEYKLVDIDNNNNS